MQIYNLKNKLEYLDEVAKLEYDEWADNKEENRKCRIERKKEKIYNAFNDEFFCKLILVDNNKLIGFISIFPKDCEEEKELTEEEIKQYLSEHRNIEDYILLDDVVFSDFDDELLSHLIKMDDTNTRGIGKGLQKKDIEEIIRRFGRKKDFKEIER